jgi:hypothetical protein
LKIAFWHSSKPRERILADAFADGVRESGDTCEKISLGAPLEMYPMPPYCDVAVMVGVKSRELYRAHTRAGIHVLYLDKGYTRHAAPGDVKLWEYWRVSLDAHHPTEWIADQRSPDDRLDRLDLVMQPWRKHGDEKHIVLAGSSAKYHEFYGLKEPSGWARKVIAALRELTDRPIVYRPKPSWSDAVPIAGATFSQGQKSIDEELIGAHLLVTHGSNAVFEAVLLGVPCIVLGEAVAKPLSDTELTKASVADPRLATYKERHQWLANLAYWQWTMPEIAAGKMWQFMRPKIYGKQKPTGAEAAERGLEGG